MKNKIIAIHAVALLVVITLAALAYYRWGIVAIVNGQPISRFEYYQNMEKQIGKNVLDQLVSENVVLAEASKKGITIEKSVIDAEISKVETQLKEQGQTLDSALASEGLSKTDFERQVEIQKMIEKLAGPIPEATQAKIDEFLTQNKAQLPKTATKAELQTLAKTQVESQLRTETLQKWFDDLKKAAKIIYR